MIGHRDILGEPQRIPVRQHQTHLALPQPLGVLRQIDVEQKRVGRDVITFDLEVMFGEHHRGPAGLIGDDGLLAQLLDGGGVTVAIQSPEAFSKVGFRCDGDRIKHPKFHDLPLSLAVFRPGLLKSPILNSMGHGGGVNA
jgi:hypothetical protein